MLWLKTKSDLTLCTASLFFFFWTECGGTFSTDGGQIQTMNHPREYENHMDCQYLIQAPSGQIILLTFQNFNLEFQSTCTYDSLQVGIQSLLQHKQAFS